MIVGYTSAYCITPNLRTPQEQCSCIPVVICVLMGMTVDLTRAQLFEVCRRYVYDNPEILDEFDISIK